MASLVAAALSSHAYTFIDPSEWDTRRAESRRNYERLRGYPPPPEQPEVAESTVEADHARFEAIGSGLEHIRSRLAALDVDVLVMIGDDQDENFTDELQPQFAVYAGESALVTEGVAEPVEYRCDTALSAQFVNDAVRAGFDLSVAHELRDGRLLSHAHREPLAFVDGHASIPTLLLFVNAIHMPAPEPLRCFELGRQLRRTLDADGTNKRVALYASGGFSHFNPGYPWGEYRGRHSLGSIDVAFDAGVVESIRQGKLRALAELSSADLLAHGGVELRQTIVMAGAIGDKRPEFIEYGAFYRAVMGMAVGWWGPDELSDGPDGGVRSDRDLYEGEG